MNDTGAVPVDDPANTRFEIAEGDERAELVYRIDGGRLVLEHTRVPEAWGGRGVGGRLVEAAVHKAAAEGLEIVAQCPFAARWIERHPDRVNEILGS
jgi:predicted GNAT family acetyltransferase